MCMCSAGAATTGPGLIRSGGAVRRRPMTPSRWSGPWPPSGRRWALRHDHGLPAALIVEFAAPFAGKAAAQAQAGALHPVILLELDRQGLAVAGADLDHAAGARAVPLAQVAPGGFQRARHAGLVDDHPIEALAARGRDGPDPVQRPHQRLLGVVVALHPTIEEGFAIILGRLVIACIALDLDRRGRDGRDLAI